MYTTDLFIFISIISALACVILFAVIKTNNLLEKCTAACSIYFILSLSIILIGIIINEYLYFIFGFLVMIIGFLLTLIIAKFMEEHK